MTTIKIGDVGTLFKATILDEDGAVVDISSATTLEMIFKKPNDTSSTVAASLFTDGTDGIMSYPTVDGDLDIAGKWKIQCFAELDTGEWHSSILNFDVGCNL